MTIVNNLNIVIIFNFVICFFTVEGDFEITAVIDAANFTGFTEQLAIARQAVRMAWAEVFSQGDEK